MFSLIDDPNQPYFEFIAKGFGLPRPRQCLPLSGGLINETFNVDDLFILQHINAIFGPAVNDDIAALTPILRNHGVNVPLLCRALNGEYSLKGEDFGLAKGRWRLMTKLEGTTIHAADNIETIRSLTRAMARFHGALDDCHYEFLHKRPGVHDFMRHYHALEMTLLDENNRRHRLWQKVSDLFDKMKNLSRYVDFNSVICCEDLRIIHGDPKVSNFMMKGDDVCGIVDLDTMARSRVSFDVGDAIRSWCNPRPEDVEPAFNREYAREVIGLYLDEAPFLSKSERTSLPSSSAFISLELAMRFAKDAICEDYFGFNPEIGHAEHSYLRAVAMYQLCDQML